MDSLLTYERMSAEVWDLAFGLEGMEGRMPTRKEEFERIAQVQDAETKWKLVEWIDQTLITHDYTGYTIDPAGWEALRKEVVLEPWKGGDLSRDGEQART